MYLYYDRIYAFFGFGLLRFSTRYLYMDKTFNESIIQDIKTQRESETQKENEKLEGESNDNIKTSNKGSDQITSSPIMPPNEPQREMNLVVSSSFSIENVEPQQQAIPTDTNEHELSEELIVSTEQQEISLNQVANDTQPVTSLSQEQKEEQKEEEKKGPKSSFQQKPTNTTKICKQMEE